jgi:serine phosphatase RsbU (regulator of sigma subunit)/Tfp pilus assembly protein PilF
MIRRVIFCVVAISFITLKISNGQNKSLDSLQTLLGSVRSDSVKCSLYLELGKIYEGINVDSALYYYGACVQLAQQLNLESTLADALFYGGILNFNAGLYDKALTLLKQGLSLDKEAKNLRGIAGSSNNIGRVYYYKGEYDLALEYYKMSLSASLELNDKNRVATCYNNIGVVYDDLGKYDVVIDFYLKSLQIAEEIEDKSAMAKCYNNLGTVCRKQGKKEQAIDYQLKSLEINLELNNKTEQAVNYLNLGNIYSDSKNLDKALHFLEKSLLINRELGSKRGMSFSYNSIGIVYEVLKEYSKAIEYLNKSIEIKQEIDDKNGAANARNSIASVYRQMANGNNSYVYLHKALMEGLKAYNTGIEIGALPIQNDAAETLRLIYNTLGDHKNAYKFAEIVITTRDSLFNMEKAKALADVEKRFAVEKKQLEIEKLEDEKAIQELQLLRQLEVSKRQKVTLIFSILGLFVTVVFTILVLHRLKITRSQKRIIEEQKVLVDQKNTLLNEQNEEISAQRDHIMSQHDLVVLQKDYIEEQAKEITDSIRYAKRIQQAVLPSGEYMKSILHDHFVLYKPKDIVSGDFYWATTQDNWLVVAAADCTGHGVPGAFMSMLGVSFLKEIVNKKGVTKPSEILNRLRESIIEVLRQEGKFGEQKDGMDISICAIDTRQKRVQFAGASSPLIIVDRKGELTTVIPDKQPVAIYEYMTNFTNHELALQDGEAIYLLSDGFADQFGGAKNKKFMAKKLKELIATIAHKPMETQKEILIQEFEGWKGETDQVDDITILGIRI